MPQFKTAAVLGIAIILQLSLREAWPPLSYIDFPLIVVVYIALQREAWQALIVGTIAGLAIDAPSGGLLGAGGFSKTLTAYLIYFAATRINLENALLRIPVLAAATLIDGAIYFFWQRSLGNPPSAPFVQTISYSLIGTTTVGTFALYMLDSVVSEQVSLRRQFASRRKVARRGAGSLKRR
ncbi:MAG: rod shape-determining protein MreD [Pyrinomonadaceae bacterium]